MTDSKPQMTLFTFVRERIVPINAVIAISATLALVLDFISPKAPYLAWVSYGLCGIVLACMALELIAPEKVNTWLKTPAQGLSKQCQRLWMERRPVWNSPAWQALALVAAVATVIGSASKARAYEGGLLASTFPAVRNYQASFSSLQDALDDLNKKIDGAQFGGIKDAAEALSTGDFQSLQRFLKKGEPLPNANATGEYALAVGLAAKKKDRLEILSLYAKDGFDINQSGVIGPLASFPKANSDKLDTWSIKQKGDGKDNSGHITVFKSTPRDADNVFILSCVELTLLEVAIINNDKEATEWLLKNGADKTAKRKCKSMTGRNKRDISAEIVASVLGKVI
jgi:hypothetical protein